MVCLRLLLSMRFGSGFDLQQLILMMSFRLILLLQMDLVYLRMSVLQALQMETPSLLVTSFILTIDFPTLASLLIRGI